MASNECCMLPCCKSQKISDPCACTRSWRMDAPRETPVKSSSSSSMRLSSSFSSVMGIRPLVVGVFGDCQHTKGTVPTLFGHSAKGGAA